MLKLARCGEDGDKALLLIESGARLHTVDSMPAKSDVPSNFTLKLRKHIRTRRLEAIQQLGVDRIVQLTFGTGDKTFHLLLEFYAQGNVILTDGKYEVLSLLRSHRDDAKGTATMARHVYPIHTVRLRQPVHPDALRGALDGSGAADGGNSASGASPGEDQEGEGKEEEGAAGVSSLKVALAGVVPYGPSVAEHCALAAGLNPDQLLVAPLTEAQHAALLAAVRAFEKWLDGCEEAATGGAIMLASAPQDGAPDPAYVEFQPLLADGRPMEQYVGKPMLTFPTFDAAISQFFGKLAGQRATNQQSAREKAALGKLEAIRSDHEARLRMLGIDAEESERKAVLIELNLDAVDAALGAVREALAGGMDWHDLGRMIKEEKKAGNPVAQLVESLQLERSQITVLLRDPMDDEDEEAEEGGGGGGSGKGRVVLTKIPLDLDLSAHANARAYYDARRKHADKSRRTLEANERALAAAEKKALEQLERVRNSAPPAAGAGGAAAVARKPYWFERFHWFVSSENYLVLSGRDAQQNELLVKRYLR